LEEELRRKHQEHTDELVEAMEEIKFNPKNEFGTKECVICMDEFKNQESILKVPTCRHFFHGECTKKWFESQKMQDY
jgi:hypothetical protein